MVEVFNFEGKPVRNLQIMLREIAVYYDTKPIVIPDGIYGEATKKAVEVFQEKYNLKITGEVDFETFEEIVKVYDFVIDRKDSRAENEEK